jgi:hypothetical protein
VALLLIGLVVVAAADDERPERDPRAEAGAPGSDHADGAGPRSGLPVSYRDTKCMPLGASGRTDNTDLSTSVTEDES